MKVSLLHLFFCSVLFSIVLFWFLSSLCYYSNRSKLASLIRPCNLSLAIYACSCSALPYTQHVEDQLQNTVNDLQMFVKLDCKQFLSISSRFSFSSHVKLLGVTIDSKLCFSEHFSSAYTMASQRIGVLMQLRNLIPTKAKLQLFKSSLLPYLTYFHLVWHFCRAGDPRKLERLQERGLRAVYKDKHASYFRYLRKLSCQL